VLQCHHPRREDRHLSRVAIVTDSTTGLPARLIEELGIHIVPVLLIQGRQTFRDGVDISPSEVYRRLRAGEEVFTSAAPTISDFLDVYRAAAEGASAVVSIHMSPELSNTYGVALVASKQVEDVQASVFNCNSAAIGQGFVVLEAARAAAAGATLDQVLHRAEEIANKIQFLFTLDTFEYLQKSGRMGGAAALLGTMLQIRPVLYIPRGTVEVFARPRTRPRAIQLILEQMAGEPQEQPLHAAIAHADALQEAEDLRRIVAERFHCAELLLTEFTPVVGAHTGPGLLGVAFYTE
jgi:DegV family protein with EDD domain